ncbi:hypothetical protein BU17DRAFT_80757 [Hysterangium stoloniferum]|nr:hypothetical protein BU17DRAFT_80757 [Hysterangium stoloniferum]
MDDYQILFAPPSTHDFRVDNKDEYSYPRDQLWLKRSRACSIDLLLNFRDPWWNFDERCHYFRREHMERILRLIAPHSPRVRRFTLVCDKFAPVHAALLFTCAHGEKMKWLKTVELYRCNEYVDEHPRFYPSERAAPIPLLGGSVAPMLTRVCLAGVHVNWVRSLSPLRGLKTLELSYHSSDVRPSLIEFTAILRSSPELMSLSIIGSGPISAQKINSKPDNRPASNLSVICQLSSILSSINHTDAGLCFGNMPFVLALPDFPSRGLLCPALKDLSLRLIPGLVSGSIAKARDAAGLRLDTLSVYFADTISLGEHELRLARDHSNVVTIFGEEEKEAN